MHTPRGLLSFAVLLLPLGGAPADRTAAAPGVSSTPASGPIDTRGSSLPAQTNDEPPPPGTPLPTPAMPPPGAFRPVTTPASRAPADSARRPAAEPAASRGSSWGLLGLLGLLGLAGLLLLRRRTRPP